MDYGGLRWIDTCSESSEETKEKSKMKKCKYHCDYGDGRYCHYKGESGCVNNEVSTSSKYSEEIMDRLVHDMTEFLEDHDIYQLMALVTAAIATKEQK